MLKSFCTGKNTIARVKKSAEGVKCVSATCQMTLKTHTWSPRKLNSKRINSSSQEVGRDLKGSGKQKRHEKPCIQKAEREKGE